MPIRADLMPLYPGGSTSSPEWQAIRTDIRERSGNRCEGSPAFPSCRVANGAAHPVTGSLVVLTVAHRNHDVTDNGPGNLAHWCQRCHNVHDLEHRRANAFRTHLRSRGDLFADQPEPAHG